MIIAPVTDGHIGMLRPLARARPTSSVAAAPSRRKATALKTSGGREPYDGDREGDEDGAAQDAGHFAPSATGDGLMPPYRRSRFW